MTGIPGVAFNWQRLGVALTDRALLTLSEVNTMVDTLTRNIGDKGEMIYDRLKPIVADGNEGRFIVIDTLSGEYEIGDDHLQTILRLRDRLPDAEPYSKKIGYVATASIGGRLVKEAEIDA